MKKLSITLQTMMKSLRMMTGNSEDPRYSEEKLLLRAACFRCLTHHLEEHTRAVYEFATIWCDEHENVGGIEQAFKIILDHMQKKHSLRVNLNNITKRKTYANIPCY